MAKVVLVRVLESVGLAEKTAKTFATKIANKQGIAKDENGFVTVEDAIVALEKSYTGEDNTSKYKASAEPVIAQLKAGKLNPEWQNIVTSATKSNPFVAGKVMKDLVAIATEKGWKDVLTAISQLEAKHAAKE